MSKLRLDSWKSIADYLERSPRTVQRWHAYHALPVHHFGGCKGSVFAYAEEIDRWLMKLAEETRTPECSQDEVLGARRSLSAELMARAGQMWEARSEESLHAIAALYRKSIDQDPGNAGALAGLANVMISAVMHSTMDSAIAYPSAMESLRRTVQLDAGNIEAKCSVAWLSLVHERKWRQAKAGFEFVLSKQPENASALGGMALLHIAQADLEPATDWAWKAWRRNTLVGFLGGLVCWCHYLSRDFESARELASQVKMVCGDGSMMAVIEVLASIQSGVGAQDLRRMEALAASFPQNATLQGALGYAYAAGGQTSAAWGIRENLEQLSGQTRRNHAYGLALVCLGLRNEEESVHWLETAYAHGSLWSLGLRSDPVLHGLRGLPRFEALVRQFAIPSVTRTRLTGVGTLAEAI